MSKIDKRYILLEPTNSNAITASNIYYNQSITIKEKIDSLVNTPGGGTTLQKLALEFSVPSEDYPSINSVLSYLKTNHYFDNVEATIIVNDKISEDSSITLDNPSNHSISLIGNESNVIDIEIPVDNQVSIEGDYTEGKLVFIECTLPSGSNIIEGDWLFIVPNDHVDESSLGTNVIDLIGAHRISNPNYTKEGSGATGILIEVKDRSSRMPNDGDWTTTPAFFKFMVVKNVIDVAGNSGLVIKTNCIEEISNLIVYSSNEEAPNTIGFSINYDENMFDLPTNSILAQFGTQPFYPIRVPRVGLLGIVGNFTAGAFINFFSAVNADTFFISGSKYGLIMLNNSLLTAKNLAIFGTYAPLRMVNNSVIVMMNDKGLGTIPF